MADEYGIQMYDNEGNVLDTNLDSALVVEGVLILGNDPIGRLALDILFPLREKFKGIFIMPVFHAFCINSGTEHASTVYFDQWSLCWNISYDARSGAARNAAHHGGAFAGRQFLYGYVN
ncbi:hypothetical protein A7P92_05690 [Eikenella corrodens]|uniref:Uncharacterized protein n=1 Tax=Eikenella corrodens TaxID=539 RepID=A0A1A9RN68_EIKCO|nr:hypothetical protein [Eikenella corrodens]OAM20337.1 hypothetical protein A7P89_10580 [Eikenella corrodens]OAM23957.1 hypothetical protein A7P92_05690 [Eikenella corrodens]DAK56038.1 MAG TPA: hypothetical protein [Caudoviricetes sp.]DAQ66698.1 MAG TPA: hypothetical protein [Caudoviricetes sp.]